MRKKRIRILEWESMVNTIAITEQEKMYTAVMNSDSIQSMKDTDREMNEVATIKQKYDRAYYTKKINNENYGKENLQSYHFG